MHWWHANGISPKHTAEGWWIICRTIRNISPNTRQAKRRANTPIPTHPILSLGTYKKTLQTEARKGGQVDRVHGQVAKGSV